MFLADAIGARAEGVGGVLARQRRVDSAQGETSPSSIIFVNRYRLSMP